jgi:hypothetical protein
MPSSDVRAILELTPKQSSPDEYVLEAVVIDGERDKALNGIEVFVENWNNSDQSLDLSAKTGERDEWSDGRAFFDVPGIALSVQVNPQGYEAETVTVDADEFPA